MELRMYVRLLVRGWWIVVLTTLAALNIALVASLYATPLYRATARFLVSPNPALISSKDEINSLQALDKRTTVSTYAEVLNSGRLYNETLTALQIDAADVIDYSAAAVVLPETSVLELNVVGTDPQLVAQIANGLGQHSINYISGLYQVYNINFLEPAEVPESPISPQPVRDVSLATALGLALGVVLAMMREQLRTPFTAMRNRLALDPASNALTARSFRTVLEEELSRSADDTVALGLIRLNGLNGLIDRLPQPVVRSILREATRILNRELRGADAVGRWADTTLAVMLPNTPAEAAVSTFGRILRALSQPFNVGDDGEVLLLEPSIGVAVRKHPEPARTLVRHTEVALHQADQDTRNLILYRVDPFLTDSVEPQHVPTQTPQPALPAPAVHVQPPALRKRRRSVLDNEDEIVKSARANFLKLTRPEIDEADFETVYSNGFSKS